MSLAHEPGETRVVECSQLEGVYGTSLLRLEATYFL
jgi:hypothetical protein